MTIKEGSTRITVDLPIELYKDVRRAMLDRDLKNLSEVVRDLLSAWLEGSSKKEFAQ